MARYFDAYDVFHSDVVQGAMLLKVSRVRLHLQHDETTRLTNCRRRLFILQQALAVFRSQRIRHFLFQFDAETSVLEMTILCENGKLM